MERHHIITYSITNGLVPECDKFEPYVTRIDAKIDEPEGDDDLAGQIIGVDHRGQAVNF